MSESLLPKRFRITVKPFLTDFLALEAEWEKEGGKLPKDAEEEWKWVEFQHWYDLMMQYTWGRSKRKQVTTKPPRLPLALRRKPKPIV